MNLNKQESANQIITEDLPVTDEQAIVKAGATSNQGKLIVGVDDVQVRCR